MHVVAKAMTGQMQDDKQQDQDQHHEHRDLHEAEDAGRRGASSPHVCAVGGGRGNPVCARVTCALGSRLFHSIFLLDVFMCGFRSALCQTRSGFTQPFSTFVDMLSDSFTSVPVSSML